MKVVYEVYIEDENYDTPPTRIELIFSELTTLEEKILKLQEIKNKLLDDLISEDNFEQYQAKVYDSIIEGFKKAIENIDKKKTNNVIFFVSIVDSDNSEIMENYSAEQLNSYDKFLTFKNRFQSKP